MVQSLTNTSHSPWAKKYKCVAFWPYLIIYSSGKNCYTSIFWTANSIASGISSKTLISITNLWNRCCVIMCLNDGDTNFNKPSSSCSDSLSFCFSVKYSRIFYYISLERLMFFIVVVANSIFSCRMLDFLFNYWKTTLIVPRIEASMKELDRSKMDVTMAWWALAGTISAPDIMDTECHIEKQ